MSIEFKMKLIVWSWEKIHSPIHIDDGKSSKFTHAHQMVFLFYDINLP